MNEKLKPCPFCAGEVEIALAGNEVEKFYIVTRGNGENRCNCRVFMESEKFYIYTTQKRMDRIKSDLINKWNRRICSCKKQNEN